MKSAVSNRDDVVVARQIQGSSTATNGEWGLDTLAGRFVELSGSASSATLTAAAALILEAQLRGEPTAWVAGRPSVFFPPDFAASGIDLEALPVIHVPDTTRAARVTDSLLRSGGFAIVVLDLGAEAVLPLAFQTRLAGLARKHHTALLCITKKGTDAPSLGSLVSIRAQVEKKRTDFDRFACEVHVVKDKRRGPGWGHREVCRGPDGMC